MNFCHSLLLDKEIIKSPSQLEAILVSSALSVACIHNLGYKINLYANSYAKQLLSDIPYDEVFDIDYFDYIPKTCYAQSKFAALELMGDNEVHIDYDVYIHKNTFVDILKTSKEDITVQYVYQVGAVKFESSLNAINYFEVLGLLRNYEGVHLGANAGIICIKNPEARRKYIEAYKNFYYKGYDLIKSVSHDNLILDSYVEEVQLLELANANNYSVYSIFGDLRLDDVNLTKTTKLANTLGYEHLCGPKISFLMKMYQDLALIDLNLYKSICKRVKLMSDTIINKL